LLHYMLLSCLLFLWTVVTADFFCLSVPAGFFAFLLHFVFLANKFDFIYMYNLVQQKLKMAHNRIGWCA